MINPEVAEYNLHPIAIIVLPIPLLIVATIALGLRIWVRCTVVRIFGKDDVLLIMAHICFTAFCGVFIAIGVTEYTQGLIGPILKLAIYSIIGILLYLLNQIFFKLSLAFYFLRILHLRWHRLIIISSVAVSIIFNLALLVISVIQCGNPAAVDVRNLSCLDWNTILGPLNYFCASLNCAVDWIFAFTVIFMVSKLHLDNRGKLSVYLIVLLATAGSIVSIARIPFITGLRLDGPSYYSSKNDVIAYTSIIESAIGIIVASMAVLKPLIPKLLEKARIALSSRNGAPSSSPVTTPMKRDNLEEHKSQVQSPPKSSPKKPTVEYAAVLLFQALPNVDETESTVLPGSRILLDLEDGYGPVPGRSGT